MLFTAYSPGITGAITHTAAAIILVMTPAAGHLSSTRAPCGAAISEHSRNGKRDRYWAALGRITPLPDRSLGTRKLGSDLLAVAAIVATGMRPT